jgi:hypothetical protein
MLAHRDERWERTDGLGYVPPHKRTVEQAREERSMLISKVSKITNNLWENKYGRGWYPLTKRLHRFWKRIRGPRLQIDASPFSVGIRSEVEISPEPRQSPVDLLIAEMKKIVGKGRRKNRQGVALLIEEAETLVVTNFFKALTNCSEFISSKTSSNMSLPHILVIATTHRFPELLRQAVSDANPDLAGVSDSKPSETEMQDIQSVQRKFEQVYLRPYKTAEGKEVIQKAIKQVLADYNREQGTEYQFHDPSAKAIMLHSAGHLYLVNLLCRCCFDEFIKHDHPKIHLTEDALKRALQKCGQFKEHIDHKDSNEEDNLIWQDAREIEKEVEKGEI